MTNAEKFKSFLQELEKIYGKAILNDNDYIYSFKNTTKARIADDLLIDTGKLSKLLNENEIDSHANLYEKYTELAKRFKKSKDFDDLRKGYQKGRNENQTLKRILASFGIVMLILLGFLLRANHIKNTAEQNLIKTEQDLVKAKEKLEDSEYDLSEDQIMTLLEILGGINSSSLVIETAIANERFKNQKGIKTAADSIRIVRESRDQAINVLGIIRSSLREFDFLKYKGYAPHELLEKATPKSSMFNCEDHVIAFSDVIPNCAGKYDTALYDITRMIFDSNLSMTDIRARVKPKIKNLQTIQNEQIKNFPEKE